MVAYSIEKDGVLSLSRNFEVEILESLGGKFDETFEEELIKSDFKFDFLICQNSENPLDSVLIKMVLQLLLVVIELPKSLRIVLI